MTHIRPVNFVYLSGTAAVIDRYVTYQAYDLLVLSFDIIKNHKCSIITEQVHVFKKDVYDFFNTFINIRTRLGEDKLVTSIIERKYF